MPRPTAAVGRRDDCPIELHDTAPAYDRGCRCPKAREASRLYRKRLKGKRQPPASIDATGTIRRMQALQAIGWRLSDIAHHYGADLHDLRIDRGTGQVYRTTADRLASVYDLLSMTPGPSGHVRVSAGKRGFPPPLAWDDDTIDDPAAEPVGYAGPPVVGVLAGAALIRRALGGDRDAAARLTPTERTAAIQQGLRDGMGRQRIATTLGIRYPTVRKIAEAFDDGRVDENVLERVTSGERVHLNAATRRAAIARLNDAGLSAREVGARLGVTKRSVQRHRAEDRAAA